MKTTLSLVIAAMMLASCQTPGLVASKDLQQKIEVLDEKVFSGTMTPGKALSSYETLYKQNKQAPEAIGAYADALRRAAKPKDAAALLKPQIAGKKIPEIADPVFMAYSRLIIDQGYYKDAEKRLMTRLTQAPESSAAQLNNLIGVALAGQHRRAEAEQAFRRALESWDGRPGVVEKNLARLQAK